MVDRIVGRAAALRVEVLQVGRGSLIDCGVEADGGLEAGRLLAETCLANLGRVTLAAGGPTGVTVQVASDRPLAACLGSQYAGWRIAPESAEGYFAMGSGPMRAAAAREPLIEEIDASEQASHVVGVLETSRQPPAEVFQYVADTCGVAVSEVTLLAARTASLAGTLQVVARSLETALHKLHELKFDLSTVRSGFGSAPLPPVAGDDLQGIGWTNDAVLYGAEVTIWTVADDAVLQHLGPRVPSCSSSDYGAPFAEIFERCGRDFYQIDGHLFSPAVVHLQSLVSGRRFTFGQFDEPLLKRSFQL